MTSHRPHPFTLRQLQYVLAVADHASFVRAAQACHVSQPALSMQIAQIEQALGMKVFDRDHRQVRPTPAGELWIPEVRRVVQLAHGLTEHARRLQDPLSSLLRVGVIPTIAPYLLSRLTPALRAAFPELVVLWTEERTSTLVAKVTGQELDAALVAAEADLGGLETAPIGVDVFTLAMPKGHRLAGSAEPVSLSELDGEPMLLLDDGHCLRTQALQACEGAGLRELAYRATSLSTLAHVVASGAGLTLLPELAAAVERTRAPIAIRPLASPAPYRTIVLAWRPGSPLRDALVTLADRSHQAFVGGPHPEAWALPEQAP
ncbi:MAG: LysR substrate-binding domain-containing protein [Myxococcota bacterium]